MVPHGSVWRWIAVVNILYSLSARDAHAVPDATAEGVLRPVLRFEDVTLFHFDVPADTTVAHWEFAAFQDDRFCPGRQVLIFLKQGSYPAVVPGASNNFDKADFHTSATASFQEAPAAGLRVASPRPGPWFAVAYMPDWDDKVELKGVTHKCRYSIGVVAHWIRNEAISTLVLGKEYELETTGSFRRFRFYVDSSVYKIAVTVKTCKLLVNSLASNVTDGNCLENLVLLPDAPPFDSVTSEAIAKSFGPVTVTAGQASLNVTTGLGKGGVYYYLGVESERVARFTLMLEALEVCGANDGVDFVAAERKVEGIGAGCPIWRRLLRVSRPRDFEADFLLESKDAVTNVLDIWERHPVLLTFDILSFVDIGGSLHVRITFDSEGTNSSRPLGAPGVDQKVVVKGFLFEDTAVNVSAAVAGFLEPNIIAVTSSSSRLGDRTHTVPFPRSGAYALLLHLECYSLSDGHEVRQTCNGAADKSGVRILLDVQTRMCSVPEWVHPTPCGPGGACREAHRRRWFFTYCECYPGHSGWNCSREAGSSSDSLGVAVGLLSPGWAVAFLTGSNAAFIPVVILAARRRMWSAAGVYAFMAAFSVAYHVCDVEEKDVDIVDRNHFCVLYFEVLAFLDFLGSCSAIWVTLSGLAKLSKEARSAVEVLGVIVVAGAVRYSRTSLLPILLPIFVGGFILIATYAWTFWRRRKIQFTSGALVLPLVGLAIALIAFLLFAFVETDRNYPIVHSLWHVLIGAALVFLLPPRVSSSSPFSGASGHSRLRDDDEHCVDNLSERLATEMLRVDVDSSDDAWLIDNRDDDDDDEEEEEENVNICGTSSRDAEGDEVVVSVDGRRCRALYR